MQDTDTITKIGNSTVHHGPFNRRAFLLKYDPSDHDRIMPGIEKLAGENHYDKIILKLPGYACDDFLKAGYQSEARILEYYADQEACYFLSKFLSSQRQKEANAQKRQGIVQSAATRPASTLRSLPQEHQLVVLGESDTEDMARIYRQVFTTYPFPIHEPDYLLETMRSHVVYFGVRCQGELVALSSAEMDVTQGNAEMTDFAILPHHRGKQLARHLLTAMEEEMVRQGIRVLYTIARAVSLPMNCTFGSHGYTYGGTLINNTQISGEIESMNIWAKKL